MQASDKAAAARSLEDMERAKYERVWNIDEYADNSPARDKHFDKILSFLEQQPTETVIEFGCGPGYAMKMLEDEGYNLLGIDHADNCLKVEALFHRSCLWEIHANISADAGYCVDVMEHIPTDKVMDVFFNIMSTVPRCLFVISLMHDRLGSRLAGEPLHLTVKPAEWWYEAACKFGKVSDKGTDGKRAWFQISR